ncbi:type VI secretion protein [Pseudomonas gingeri]|nr:type VI secretion protein [Pseudomonas gingeri]
MKRIKFLGTRCALAIFMIFQISGCSLFAPKVSLQKVIIDVEPLANSNTPLALDFVAVADPQLLERLKGTPADQWFAQREQFRRDFPLGLNVWSLEVVPGQLVKYASNPLQGEKAEGVLLFAGYSTSGAHRLLLDKQPDIWLKVGAREMRLLDAQGQ